MEVQKALMEPSPISPRTSQMSHKALLYSREQEGLKVPYFLPSHIARNTVL